jgi:hypothetical protein
MKNYLYRITQQQIVRMAQQRFTLSLGQHRANCDDLACRILIGQDRDRQDRDKVTAAAATRSRRPTFVRNCWFSPVQCLLRGGRQMNDFFK